MSKTPQSRPKAKPDFSQAVSDHYSYSILSQCFLKWGGRMRGLKLWALLLMVPASANAHMCGVAEVHRTEEGVRIKFANTPSIEVHRHEGRFEKYSPLPNSAEGFEVYSMRGELISIVPSEITFRHGDKALMSNSPHDSCSITVENRDGKTGVRLVSVFAPMLPPGYTPEAPVREIFVVAE
ncbi:MAG: hypothetical protein QM645_09680 [Asticcacaulis sp.]